MADPFPGTSRLIAVATKQFPRYSEADVIELADGRLFLSLGRKDGASDFAKGTLVGFFSHDTGLTWDDQPHLVQSPFTDVSDLMSVSLCRTKRGIHLFFLGRGPDPKSDTRVYQMLSTDEAKSWSGPERISPGPGYHIVNNARVILTSAGRLVVPCAHTDGPIDKLYDTQHVFCLLSDDLGQTWKQGGQVGLTTAPLMEPGIAECADGTLYMVLRTKTGTLYEARSKDAGDTWVGLRSTTLPAPEAPATVTRDPASHDLWLFWCDCAKANWKGRSRIVGAVSHDHGRTWVNPRPIEDDARHSYGYTSVTLVRNHALLTYYDWRDDGQPGFHMTSLRQRLIPLGWFKDEILPPTFRTTSTPVLKKDQDWEGKILSANSGLLVDKGSWRLWYTAGTLDPTGEHMRICSVDSRDEGVTWQHKSHALTFGGDGDAKANLYHASVHRDGDGDVLIGYFWRRASATDSALYRYTSQDGANWHRDPDHPLIASHNAKAAIKESAGEDRISNDAFDVLRNPDGSWEYFAAVVEKATDPRQIIKHDNAAGLVRVIGRATSGDGSDFSPVEIILSPDYRGGDSYDTQFYGLTTFRYRRFYLGLLHVFHVESQTITPEWTWSHDGINWARTRTPAAALGDEGSFDSRMLLFGKVVITADEVVWLYAGYDWRHNAFRKGEVSSAIGRATLTRAELDRWLNTLPEP